MIGGHDPGWMAPTIRDDWRNLSSLIMVHRHTLLGAGKTRGETNYYMSSLEDVRASELPGYIRSHWSIENRCHWVSNRPPSTSLPNTTRSAAASKPSAMSAITA